MLRDTSGQDVVLAPKNKSKKLLLIGAIVVTTLVASVAFALPKMSSMFGSDLTISKERLRFATVTRGNLQRDIGVQGRVVAANSPTLYASDTGIVSLFVKAGDTVVANQKLAVIDSPKLMNQYSQEKARLAQLELAVGRHKIEMKSSQLNRQQQVEMSDVDLEAASVNKNRAEVSIADGLISKKDHEEKVSAYKRAVLAHKHAKQVFDLERESMAFELRSKESELARQQFVVADLKRQVDELTLTAPTNGIIGSVNVREKDNVAINTSLITVIDLSVFEVEVSIPENFADDLGVGFASEITVNNQKYLGKVMAISPEVNNGQVVGRLSFNENNIASLRQNQRVSARILIESKQDVLKVRRGAFIETGGGRVVYKVDGDNAYKQKVSLGARSMSEIEVTNGLKQGDQIVVSSIDIFNDEDAIYLSK